MTARKVVLTDVSEQVRLEDFSLSQTPDLRLPGSGDWSVARGTLRGGVSEGVDVLEVNNGALSVSLLPTRGMGIWRGTCHGLDLGWNSPVRWPVHPSYVNLLDRDGLGWLNGFNEWMCRCGLASNGPPGTDAVRNADGTISRSPLTLHGRIANLPAHYVDLEVSTEGRGTLAVRGIVDEASVFGPCLRLTSTLTTEAGSNRFTVSDEVANLGGGPAELQLLYHTNVGRPFLEAGARFAAPVQDVAPRDPRAAEGIERWSDYDGAVAGYAEQVYYLRLHADQSGRTLVLLRNAAGDRGMSLRFSVRELPYFVLWKNTQAEADGYVTGLEPALNLPNLKPFERAHGRVVSLAPGERYRAGFEVAVHASSEEVAAVEREIAALQSAPPTVHPHPQPGDSPAGTEDAAWKVEE